MKQYTHPDLTGIHGNTAFTLNGIQYPRSWWRTVSPSEIEALGFTEIVPEPIEPDTRLNIITAPKQGFGGPSMKELFNGNR